MRKPYSQYLVNYARSVSIEMILPPQFVPVLNGLQHSKCLSNVHNVDDFENTTTSETHLSSKSHPETTCDYDERVKGASTAASEIQEAVAHQKKKKTK